MTGRASGGDPSQVDRRTAPAVLERLLWLVFVLGGLMLLGDGLAKNFYIEGTSEALREAAVGVRLVWAASVALAGLSGYAWWRGAPGWCWVLVVAAPVVCSGLLAGWAETLFPQLAFLV